MAEVLDALEQLPQKHFLRDRVQALRGISRFHYLDNNMDVALRAAAEAVRVALLGGHRPLEARSRFTLAIALREAHDFSASLREMAQALEIARAHGDAVLEAELLNSLGNSYSDVGLQSEALAIFEQVAAFFEAKKDHVSAWMALDNAAIAALRLGDIARSATLAARAKAAWSGEARTSNEHLWVVQGALTNCELFIQLDRVEEASAYARAALASARASGLAQAETLAAIAAAITNFMSGAADDKAIERAIERARRESPNSYASALEAAIRTYERADQLDKAFSFQSELLAFNRDRKYEAVRCILGRASPEEAHGTAKLAQLGTAVDRRVTELVNAAIMQALRAGHDHTRVFRVSRLAEGFTTSQGWSRNRVQSIALGAKLIDIGMMVIPDELLSRPRTLLDSERRVLGEHVRFGTEVISRARLALLESCLPMVEFHHERWDGTGPCAMRGDAIPEEARVVALCDCLDALTHARPWRQAFTVQSALQILDDEAGTHFDPGIIKRFIAWVQEEVGKVKDLDAHLAAEAEENSFVMTRRRIQRLVQSQQP